MRYPFPHPGTRALYDLDQGSSEWHKMRKGRVTGTRAARILVGKEEEVMREMIRDINDSVAEIYVSDAMKRGTKMEPVARRDYVNEFNKTGFEVGMVIHREYPWLSYSPDWVITEFGEVAAHLEIKVPWSGLYETIPPQYYEQCRVGMEVIGVNKCDLFIWNESEVEIVHLERDALWWDQAEERLLAFYSKFLSIKDDQDACGKYLRPKVDLKSGKDWEDAAQEFIDSTADLETAKLNLEAARHKLIELSGGQSCVGSGVRVTVADRNGKQQYRIGIDKEKK